MQPMETGKVDYSKIKPENTANFVQYSKLQGWNLAFLGQCFPIRVSMLHDILLDFQF